MSTKISRRRRIESLCRRTLIYSPIIFPETISIACIVLHFSNLHFETQLCSIICSTILQGIHFILFIVMESLSLSVENQSSREEKIKGKFDSPNNSENANLFMSDITPKLQFRKDVSRACWDREMGMSEIIERKGGMWTTTGITRGSKLYCSIEETLFLAERGALHLLDSNDKNFTLKDLYEMVADGKYGCSWECFKAFRHLKSLGYIVGRHGIPWTLKDDTNLHISTCPEGIQEREGVSTNELNEYDSIRNRFGNIQISELGLAFDVYLPNSKFKKSSPGNPDFVVCIARNPPSKLEIEDLERICNGVPLKICNVEHGLVSFFSFNNIELPVLP